jgi:hypothetical protein
MSICCGILSASYRWRKVCSFSCYVTIPEKEGSLSRSESRAKMSHLGEHSRNTTPASLRYFPEVIRRPWISAAPSFHCHFICPPSALPAPLCPRHALVRPSGRRTRLEPQCLPNGINTLFGNANDLFFNLIPIDSVLPSSLLNFHRRVGCVHIDTHPLLCWTELIDSFQCFVRVQPHLITMIPRHRLRATALLTQMLCTFPLLPGQTQMIRLYIPQIEYRSLPDHYLCFIVAGPWINSLLTHPRRAALIQTYQEDLCITAWPAIMW